MAEDNNIVEKQNSKDSTPNRTKRSESFFSRINPVVQGLNSLQESGALGTIADTTKAVVPQAADVVKTAQGGLSVAGGCRCLTKELDMIAC